MMIFMSDQGAWTLGQSTDIFRGPTSNSCPDPVVQVYFIMDQTGPAKKVVPCVFALLLDREGQTYYETLDNHQIPGDIPGGIVQHTLWPQTLMKVLSMHWGCVS
jgi:hypothetical protein